MIIDLGISEEDLQRIINELGDDSTTFDGEKYLKLLSHRHCVEFRRLRKQNKPKGKR